MKKLRVSVDGKSYEVLVEVLDEGQPQAPARPAANQPLELASVQVSAPQSTAVSAAPAQAGDVVSPLAGKVVSVDVALGAGVAAGAQLITLEAMKMNTYVFAPSAGSIKEILVNAGDAVEEGQSLIRLA